MYLVHILGHSFLHHQRWFGFDALEKVLCSLTENMAAPALVAPGRGLVANLAFFPGLLAWGDLRAPLWV